MNKSFIPALLILISLFIFHYIGMKYFLYIKISWYDIMAHIMGGMAIFLSLYWCMKTYFNDNYILNNTWLIIIITIIIGVLWEVMEWYFDITIAPVNTLVYKIDTIKDLLDDTLGAIIAYLFLK